MPSFKSSQNANLLSVRLQVIFAHFFSRYNFCCIQCLVWSRSINTDICVEFSSYLNITDITTILGHDTLRAPTRRNKLQLLAALGAGGVSLAISLGAGLPLLGRVYNPNIPVSISTNGALYGPGEFMGLFLLIYLGTLSIIMWASFVPNIAVLKMPFWAMKASFAAIFILSVLSSALVMVFMIEPQKTFTSSLVGGSGDPLLSAAGCFYFVSFAYMAILTGSILFHVSSGVKTLRQRVVEVISRTKVAAFVALCLTLWFEISHACLRFLVLLFPTSCARHLVIICSDCPLTFRGGRNVAGEVLSCIIAVLAGQLGVV